MFRLGLIVNPLAGLGGPAALKGSDGSEVQAQALARGALPRSGDRAQRCLSWVAQWLQNHPHPCEILTWAGTMGADWARNCGLPVRVIGASDEANTTTAEDSSKAAEALHHAGCDLICFVGGDGTARNIVDALKDRQQAVLGIPAGVKMHSGVYAINPEAAGEVICQLMARELVSLVEAEVRDIDESALRQGTLRTRHYGELSVPEAHQFVQQVKQGGREVEDLVLDDIAADISERLDHHTLYLFGTGSTIAGIMERLDLSPSLLGVDAMLAGELVGRDLSAVELEQLCQQHSGPVVVVVTAIGGQGHILGRGNQQFSPRVLRRAGRENLWVVATRSKMLALEQRPLLMDSNDAELDRQWSGLVPVICGYRDNLLYSLSGGLPGDNTQ